VGDAPSRGGDPLMDTGSAPVLLLDGAPASRAADLLLSLLVIGAPLAVGVVHPQSWMVVAGLATLALVLAAAGERRVALPHPLLLSLFVLAGLSTVALLVPVPPGLRGLLSPAAEALRGMAPPTDPALWLPLHLAPVEGAVAAIRLWAIVAFGLTCSIRAVHWEWRVLALRVLVVAGVVSVIVTVAQTAMGEREVLGLYTPVQEARRLWLAPMINENHWGAWLGIIVPVAVGLVRMTPGRLLESMIWGSIGLAVLGFAFLGESRSGLGGLFVAMAVLVFGRSIAGSDRSTATRRLLTSALLVAVLAVPLGLRIAHKSAPAVDNLTGEPIPRVETEARRYLIPDTLALAADHPWTGVGPGAFFDAFPRYRTHGMGRAMNRFAESVPAQLLADHGWVVGGLLLLLGLAVLVASVDMARRHPSRIGAAAALVGLGVHELADFAMNTGAIVLAALALAVIALQRERVRRVPRVAFLTAIAAILAVSAAIVAPRYARDLDTDVAGILAEPRVDSAVLTAREDELLARWPSSYLAAQELMRLRAWRGDMQRALILANRAIALNPRHADPHLFTARLLFGVGLISQAWLSYRDALRWDWRAGAGPIIGEVLERSDDLFALERIVPTDVPGALSRVAQIVQDRGDPRGHVLALRARTEDPDGPLTPLVVSNALLAGGDLPGAVEVVRQGLDRGGLSGPIQLRLLRVLARAGEGPEARSRLRALLADGTVDGQGWLVLGTWHLDAGETKEARSALQRASSARSNRTRALALYHRARLEEQEGNIDQAVSLLERSLLEWDGHPHALLASARLIAQTGLRTSALARAKRALYLEPRNPEAKALVAALQASAAAQSAPIPGPDFTELPEGYSP
jgi:O-antigen ligase